MRSGSGAFGFQSISPDHSRLRLRYSEDLQRVEALCLTPRSAVRHIQREGIRNFLQYITEAPSLAIDWESGTKVPRSLKLGLRWVPYQNLLG